MTDLPSRIHVIAAINEQTYSHISKAEVILFSKELLKIQFQETIEYGLKIIRGLYKPSSTS